jgi:hypothetical protein
MTSSLPNPVPAGYLKQPQDDEYQQQYNNRRLGYTWEGNEPRPGHERAMNLGLNLQVKNKLFLVLAKI